MGLLPADAVLTRLAAADGPPPGILTPVYATTILAHASLVSYWHLGELAGAIAADAKGANPGAYTGGVTLGQPGLLTGYSDTSVLLDGASGYVDVFPAASLVALTAAWSAEAWFKTTPGGNISNVLLVGGQFAGGKNNFSLGFGLTAGGGAANGLSAGFIGASVAAVNMGYSASFDDHLRHHAVGTWDGTTLRLYLDGVLAASNVPGLSPTAATGNHVYLGRRWDAANFLGATLDEVAVYNTALSAAEVLNHYRLGAGLALLPGAYSMVTADALP